MFDDGSYTPFVKDCIAAVTGCDIYIIIQGNKIGSYPPGEKYRTYTEIELDTALKESKKIFCLRLTEFNTEEIDDKIKLNQILAKFDGYPQHRFSTQIELELSIYECLIPFASLNPVTTTNPFKGLAAFEPTDGAYFYGRRQEIDNCLKMIFSKQKNHFISVIGNSGVGKTSFVQAGILYKLKNEPHWGFSDYIQVVVNPGNQPYSNLLFQLHKNGLTHESLLPIENNSVHFVLFLNQLEEIITQCTDNAAIKEREQLFELLDKLAAGNNGDRCIIIASFRSDFISQLANFDFIKQYQVFFPLSSLDYRIRAAEWEEAISDIITRPAMENGVTIESQLVKQLMKEIKDVEGSLPILQFTLQQLWNADTIKDGIITVAEYVTLSGEKGMSGIIEKHAENVIKRITLDGTSGENVAILKSIFINLVEVNSSLLDVKKTVSKSDLLKKLNKYPPEKVNVILEDLIQKDSRLLVVTGATEAAKIDIIHEVLIRKWDRLANWINERRNALLIRETLLGNIAEWKTNDTDPELLYSPGRLQVIKEWQEQNTDLSDDTIKTFIAASEQKKDLIYKAYLLKDVDAWHKMNRQNKYLYRGKQLMELKGWAVNNQGSIDTLVKAFIAGANRKHRLIVTQVVVLFFAIAIGISGWIYLNKKKAYEELCVNSPVMQLWRKSHPGADPSKAYFITINNENYLNYLSCFDALTSIQIISTNTQIALSGIKDQNRLRSLSLLNEFSIGDLKGIERLTSLDSLKLSAQRINLEGIKNARNLTYLKITAVDSLVGLSEVGSLKKLTYLALELSEKTTPFHFLKDCPSLSTLNISSGESLNIIGINEIKSLKHLTISCDSLENITELQKMDKLESINLERLRSFNSVGDFKNCKRLLSLTLNDLQDLNSLSGIESFVLLRRLNLSELGRLTELKGIDQLKKLNTLSIDAKNISRIELEQLALLPISKLQLYNPNNLDFIKSLTLLDSLEIESPSKNIKNFTINNPNLKNILLAQFTDRTQVTLASGTSKISKLELRAFKGTIILPDAIHQDIDTLVLMMYSRDENRSFRPASPFANVRSLNCLVLNNLNNFEVLHQFKQIKTLRIQSGQLIHIDTNMLKQLTNLQDLYIDYRIRNEELQLIKKELPGCTIIAKQVIMPY